MRFPLLYISICSAFAWAQDGRCSSGRDCPRSDPVCSEWGYCQCASYKPGDPACYGQGGGGGLEGSDEDTCSGNAPSVDGVYCLNDRGTISCRNRGDCPDDFFHELYDIEYLRRADVRNDSCPDEHPCRYGDNLCGKLVYGVQGGRGPYCPESPSDPRRVTTSFRTYFYVRCEDGNECKEVISYSAVRHCLERGECRELPGPAEPAYDALPPLKATALGGQILIYDRSLTSLASNGCPNERPCRYRGNWCGKAVGLGSAGKYAACPKTPFHRKRVTSRG